MQPGEILKLRYEVIELIAIGGMSHVYKGKDLITKQNIAIKQVPINDSSHFITLNKRLKREYDILFKINHPNLVNTIEIFNEKEYQYLILEYIEGDTLSRLFHLDKEIFSFQEKVKLAISLASAIDVVHQKGIIHRDVKPDNIIINRKNTLATLLDFGISKSLFDNLETLTSSNIPVGSIDYISPEQINNNLSPKSDIFSFGIVLYQLFSWKSESPFSGYSVYDTAANILNKIVTFKVSKKHQEKKEYVIISKVINQMLLQNPQKRIMLDEILKTLKSLLK